MERLGGMNLGLATLSCLWAGEGGGMYLVLRLFCFVLVMGEMNLMGNAGCAVNVVGG